MHHERGTLKLWNFEIIQELLTQSERERDRERERERDRQRQTETERETFALQYKQIFSRRREKMFSFPLPP